MRKLKIAGAISTIIMTAFLLVLLISPTIRSQIMSISGLAVAQSSIQWNNVKDAAVGDAQTSGLLASGQYVYDATGATWNRMRGSASGVMSVSLPSTGLLTLLNAVAAPTVGATNNISTTFPSKMTWELRVAGVVATQTTNLEGSIDGTNFYVLDTCTTVTNEMRHVGLKPILYVRANCTGVGAGGGNITVRFIGGGN
jgi:hypothetical protein